MTTRGGAAWKLQQHLFQHRHEDKSPAVHREITEFLWSDVDRGVVLGFRGIGKSTLVEEVLTIAAGFRLFHNCLIIGSSEARAAERLAAVSNELKMNDGVKQQWGDMVGDPWTQTKLGLRWGGCIQAMGRDQDIRGLKHLDWRPDLVIVDDFEDKDNVQTPEGRRKTLRWFLAELLPACDPKRKVRVLATPMDAESVPMLLIRKPRPAWDVKVFPILYLDGEGVETPTWPARFPLAWCSRERADYEALGEIDIWEREFMCNAVSSASRVFKPEMIRVAPVEHTFQAKWAMIDPARTTRRTSAMTGWAVWSWERHRLVVWEAGARHMMPDEIVDLAFRLAGEHEPVDVGIEEDGLNEWLLQPIRSRMLRDGTIPCRAVRAPKGKLDFIRGLQPFFSAGEVTLCSEMPELREQLLSFPTGRIDAPNALAYALQLRPGRLIYDGWNARQHILPFQAQNSYVREYSLALNATRTIVTGMLVVSIDGRVVVVADFVREGDPGEAAESILREASIRSAGRLTAFAGPQHFDQWRNVGLVQALRASGCDCRPGGAVEAGREFIRAELGRSVAGEPSFAVSDGASWTLRAFAGGYARSVRDGEIHQEATDNRYRTLMEGLESFCGLFAWQNESDQNRNWAFDREGRRYLSAAPDRTLNARQ